MRTHFSAWKKRHEGKKYIKAYKIMKVTQRANRNDCSLFLASLEWLAMNINQSMFQGNGMCLFFPATQLSCKTPLWQNSFQTKSIAVFKKRLDPPFQNFVCKHHLDAASSLLSSQTANCHEKEVYAHTRFPKYLLHITVKESELHRSVAWLPVDF